MTKKVKGFSLAELLIALLIISLVLSAAIPTLTKKSAKSSEKIWRWANQNNSIYAAVGGNQSVLIGAEQKAFERNLSKAQILQNIFADSEVQSMITNNALTNISNRFTPDGDKLVLYKQSILDGERQDNLINSHISFYNLEQEGGGAAVNSIHYAGRIAADAHNLAFGIGSLQNSVAIKTKITDLNQNYFGYNTAIGHYASFANSMGQYNTAVGEKALTLNTNTNFNTAVGYHSLYTLSTAAISEHSGQNSGVGAFSLQGLKDGSDNTAVGYMALGAPTPLGAPPVFYNGSGNTAIGSGACQSIQGSRNICIGYQAGAKNTLTSMNNKFFLGNGTIPLMTGNMLADTNASGGNDFLFNRYKNLNINADLFQVNNGNSNSPAFIINTTDNRNNKFYFIADGNLGQSGAVVTNGAVFSISETGNGEILLDSHDNGINGGNARNIVFSNKLFFGFPPGQKEYEKVSIAGLGNKVGISIVGSGIDLMGNVNANDAVSIEKNSPNAPSKNRFSVKTYGQNNDAFVIDVESNSDTMISTPAKDRMYFYNKDNFIAKDAIKFKLIKATQNIDVASGATLTLQGLTTSSKDVAININSIWDAIKNLRYPSSDIRLKENISDNTAGLKEINSLEVKNYTFKEDKEKTPHVGVIAQQLQKVFPNAVIKGDDGYLKIRQEDIFYAMVNSIKELFAKIQDLTAKITGLDKRITELEKENAQLKKQNEEFEKRLSKLEKASK